MINIGDLLICDFPLMLAPMEDISDPPFRRICKNNGADIMYTEFISSEGLIREAIKSKKKLDIFNYERPIGIQIFGGDKEAMSLSAKIAETVMPDILDINFGCPVKKVVTKGAGAAVLKDIDLMVSIAKSVVNSVNIPVTVKTRLGWDDSSINVNDVVLRLQDVGVKAITIHARTRCQMYKGKADWSHIYKIKNNPDVKIPIFGNGDISTPEQVLFYKQNNYSDGIMIGRACIGNPWIFNRIKYFLKTGEYLPKPTIKERINIIKDHLKWSIEWKGEKEGINEMKKHYNNYLKEIPGVKAIKKLLFKETNYNIIISLIEEIESL